MDKIKEIIPYVIIIVTVILIRTFIATPVRVNGPSMNNTLKEGYLLILNKIGKVDKGDIVVVDLEDEKVIKRVIAGPNDSIYCLNGDIYVNDKKIKENYTSSETLDFNKVYLKDDEYFVMGDNRMVSKDSRSFDAVKKDQIIGTSRFIFWPLSEFGIAK